jgi:N-methylhydantoinase A
MSEDHQDVDAINHMFSIMEKQGHDVLTREGMPAQDISCSRQIEMRYAGQSYELPIDCPSGRLTHELLSRMKQQFHFEHDRAYGHGYPNEPTELVNFRLTAIGAIKKPRFREIPRSEGTIDAARKGMRQVFFEEAADFLQTPVYDRGSADAIEAATVRMTRDSKFRIGGIPPWVQQR